MTGSTNYNINHEPEPDQSVEVGQSRAKDTSEHAVTIADDSGAQKVATKTNNNGIGNILGNNETSQDPIGIVAPRKKHVWNNWAVIGEAHESYILKQHETESSSKSSDWRVIMPANNNQQEITLEVNVDGGNTGN
ncbi:PREDICTED: uncharacterized protein LOC109351826 [Lupinus angustifolius]|uniref:uncharacterized protein LOC109351826 n=1 Tax=Lupinus angustifolius TaxID=3871 RepID=UPI00092E6867|nr:PREDICTED: uncharacterized protein LOC109351826 [Lupinus angustifolius]